MLCGGCIKHSSCFANFLFTVAAIPSGAWVPASRKFIHENGEKLHPYLWPDAGKHTGVVSQSVLNNCGSAACLREDKIYVYRSSEPKSSRLAKLTRGAILDEEPRLSSYTCGCSSGGRSLLVSSCVPRVATAAVVHFMSLNAALTLVSL